MRIHLTITGKKTTVSVDDQLMDYLGAWLVSGFPEYHKRAKKQHTIALDFIREYVARNAEDIPKKNLSQHLQSIIIKSIAADGLADIIDARGPRYKKQPVNTRSLFESDEQMQAAIKKLLGGNAFPL